MTSYMTSTIRSADRRRLRRDPRPRLARGARRDPVGLDEQARRLHDALHGDGALRQRAVRRPERAHPRPGSTTGAAAS